VFLFAGAEGVSRDADAAFGARAARIGHANVLEVADHGRWQDTPFVATEPADGTTLSNALDALRAAGSWATLEEVRAVFDALCLGVAAGHRDRAAGSPEHGLLSPRSVLLVGTPKPDRLLAAEEVKVLDFGLARWLGLRCPMPEGVADARAPEQRANPETLTPAGDVFALGALLATMLAPHEAGLPGRVWADLAQRGPDSLRTFLGGLRRDVPPAVWDEVGRALSASPTDRHPDADRLRMALRRLDWTPIAEAPAPHRRPALVPLAAAEVSRSVSLPRSFSAEPATAPMTLRAAGPVVPAPVPVPAPASRSFAEPVGDTEILLGPRSFAADSPDTVIQSLPDDVDARTPQTFATESPDTVVETRTDPPPPIAPTRRRNTPHPLRLSAPDASVLDARVARLGTPPPKSAMPPRGPTRPAPAPASKAWLAPPEATASVDLFAPSGPALSPRNHTMPLGGPVASSDLFAEYLNAPSVPPAVSPLGPPPVPPEDPPRMPPPVPPEAPRESLVSFAPSLTGGPLEHLESGSHVAAGWHAAPPPDAVQQFHNDLFDATIPVAPLRPAPPPEPLWRRGLVLVGAGLGAALLSFLLGMWIFSPAR